MYVCCLTLVNNEYYCFTFNIQFYLLSPMNNQIQNKIISAANRRLAHYGYSKTTMAEIAKDCDMSVGNLYRFYKNKEAIAAAGAERCMQEQAEVSEAAAQDKTNSLEQLHTYLNARLRYMHQFFSETPHLHELVELISTHHGEILQAYENRTIEYMTQIIKHGQQSGALRTGDAKVMAANLYLATYCFDMPTCLQGALADKEKQLQSLINTIYNGLANP